MRADSMRRGQTDLRMRRTRRSESPGSTYCTHGASSTNHMMRAEMITITEPRASAIT